MIEVQTAPSGTTVTNDVRPYNATLPCAQDDYTHFNTDRTVVVNQGPVKCSPSGAQTSSGKWEFASNETEMLFDPGTPPDIHYRIQELTATTLSYVETSVSVSGTQFVRTTTYTAL
ncbi:hypothetical protein GCM10028824_41280 [Hymenobacter segetis]|uniref:Lipocalin-like domain-containing protein n=1 Tax=Hymenobacter segetis TaxID=2025509 RepID=A0ABU9M102_9BACT